MSNSKTSIKKVCDMGKRQYEAFYEKIEPYIHEGKLDLKDVRATEKLDAVAVSFGYDSIGGVFIESSRSGKIYTPDDFHGAFGDLYRVTLRGLIGKFADRLKNIFNEYGAFKVVGELFFVKDAIEDDDGTITFIATKYNKDAFAKNGTIVMFNSVEGDDRIRDLLVGFSDDEWSFDKLEECGVDGEIDIDAYSSRTFSDSFSEFFENTGSKYGNGDSYIEGIVLNVNGEMVGVSNPKWREIKKINFEYKTNIDSIRFKFYKDIAGSHFRKKIRASIDSDRALMERKLNMYLPRFIKSSHDEIKRFREGKDALPKNIINNTETYVEHYAKRISSLDPNDLDSFERFCFV